ncbi:MAG: hypothetical protein JXM69_10515 [Anaerolineae bacterium]|nr:hypothetical protein [Anaerolineae bacterium]
MPAYLPNGQPRIQHTTVVAVNNPANTGFYALVVIQDVTDLTNRLHDYRTIRDQLQAYTVDLERSNRELENFAYIASHDLQEPLRKIQLFSHRLHTRYAGSLNEQALDYLHRMLNAATRMQDLIEDLLTYSRVTTRAHPFEQVDLNRIASEVLTDLEGRIEESGGQITVGLLPTIEADAVQMRQLLQNLIGNSLKYHQPGKPPLVKIRAKINNGWCELTIEDNGIGFDEKNLERIFHVFERLHGRGKYEGTGIGLAICRKIVVDRHRGNITARSTPGEGTTFMVTLPVQQAQSPATTATRSKHAAGP